MKKRIILKSKTEERIIYLKKIQPILKSIKENAQKMEIAKKAFKMQDKERKKFVNNENEEANAISKGKQRI